MTKETSSNSGNLVETVLRYFRKRWYMFYVVWFFIRFHIWWYKIICHDICGQLKYRAVLYLFLTLQLLLAFSIYFRQARSPQHTFSIVFELVHRMVLLLDSLGVRVRQSPSFLAILFTTVRCSLQLAPCSLLLTPYSLLLTPYSLLLTP